MSVPPPFEDEEQPTNPAPNNVTAASDARALRAIREVPEAFLNISPP